MRYTIEELKRLPGKTDWKRLDAMSDDDIDTSDIPPLTKEWFDEALLVMPRTRSGSRDWHARVEEAMRRRAKKPISLRLDPDVYAWFKRQGPRYQSRINAVLKAYMEAHRK
jgi:uncharacterized protein (DUF4415 family)